METVRYPILLLDADGTLYDFKTSQAHALERAYRGAGFGDILPYSCEILEQYSRVNQSWWQRLERGECTKEELQLGRFREFFAALGISFDPAEFNRMYMEELGKAMDQLNLIRLSDRQVYAYIDALFPIMDGSTEQQKKNVLRLREEVKSRYYEAPDLKHVGKNGYRFVNAVSDFAIHAKPLRESAKYRENLFVRTVEGNPLIDRAYQMCRAA